MSANSNVLGTSRTIDTSSVKATTEESPKSSVVHGWDPEDFGREQILALVRNAFFPNSDPSPRQVLFSPSEPSLNITRICDRVAETLASETRSDVALLETRQQSLETVYRHPSLGREARTIKSWSIQKSANLWQVPRCALQQFVEESGVRWEWAPCLHRLRQEFEYVIIHGPSAGISSEAALLGQFSDGIVLVLGARTTRRATARKIKEKLQGAGCRILGTVLMDRTFPIPECIYHKL